MIRGVTRCGVLAGLAALGTPLAACGAGGVGGGAAGDATPAGVVRPPAQPVTVTIWHSWDKVRTPPWEKVLADFQAAHPTIRPEHTVLTPGVEVLQKLQAAAAGGTPPDLRAAAGTAA